ncbi:hypothetical protein L1077_00385 [Pseudoalteromonas luteoviolacea]|uniref:hypothetical protein n=1 Tax=Pseudoalteromonas luteoviolacea TaxID=43657 RepID=UPI001F1EB631|nr:hypothetical protein [Pseudoalteromonas luteoviolacea]MCF6437890.1 hypothetical protein [Pseudoalteromonas luteoviolacea]
MNEHINYQHAPAHQKLLACHLAGQAVKPPLGSSLESEFSNIIDYRYSCWPFVVSPSLQRGFSDIIEGVHDVFYNALSLYFESDAQAFADYFEVPAITYEFLQDNQFDTSQVIARYDIIMQDGKGKILEVNAGTNLGGWEFDIVADEVIANAHSFDKSIRLSYPYVIQSLFRHTERVLEEKNGLSGCANILFIAPEFTDNRLQQMWLNQQVHSCGLNGTFKLLFCDSPAQLREQDGFIYSGKNKIDVIFWPEMQKRSDFVLQILKSQLAGNIIFFDSPVCTLLGHKVMLALLHEEKVLSQLNEKQRQFVIEHVPWTVKLNREEVMFNQESWQLRKLLMQKRTELVVKKSNSFQGEHVHVGSSSSPAEWETLIDGLLGSNDWIAQQFVSADPITAVNNDSEVLDYKPVWGSFDFGGRYRGNIIRAVEAEMSDGAINGANDALCFLVCEQRKTTKKLVI